MANKQRHRLPRSYAAELSKIAASITESVAYLERLLAESTRLTPDISEVTSNLEDANSALLKLADDLFFLDAQFVKAKPLRDQDKLVPRAIDPLTWEKILDSSTQYRFPIYRGAIQEAANKLGVSLHAVAAIALLDHPLGFREKEVQELTGLIEASDQYLPAARNGIAKIDALLPPPGRRRQL
jgi:hypothetical protein